MSDSAQGPGWWQASDGKWYPPEQHPDAGAPTEAIESTPPTQAMPTAPPPAGAPPLTPAGAPPGPGGPGRSGNGRWVALAVVAALIIAVVAFLLLRDDDKQGVAANSSAPPASSSSSSGSTSTSSSSSSTSTSSSSALDRLTESQLRGRLLKAADLGSDFTDETYTPSTTDPTSCGSPNVNSAVPPDRQVGSDASSGSAFFEEQVTVYTSESDARQAMSLIRDGLDCTQPTVQGGGPMELTGPNDVSSDIDVLVDEADEYEVRTEEAQGKLIVIRVGDVIVSFQFASQTGADVSHLPDELDVVNTGLDRLAS